MEHRSQAESALGGAAYGMLFVLGVVMAIVGGFTHPVWQSGLIPVSAIVWVLALFGVCAGAGLLDAGEARRHDGRARVAAGDDAVHAGAERR